MEADPAPFAREALALIPKLLTLEDRNPHSSTYGCFDRNFWHYKILDFPSGMAQEFVWPLALAWALDIPGSPWRGEPALREWARAGILYAARAAHSDGSCDDYFPFEKAGGAAAFSLLACLEAYALLGIDEPEALAFFAKRADWLAGHHESGRLSNHQALIVLCLDLAGEMLKTSRWERAREARLERVLEWQHEEGWFQEYEGCDPGYHTLTISLLARVHERHPEPRLRGALERAVRFAGQFIHPDGSFGGEYASRNTHNFFPHGFEVFGRHMPEALAINDCYLQGLEAGLGPCHADDHILGHHAWNYLLAWRDFTRPRPPAAAPAEGRRVFPGAGLVAERRGGAALFLALNKGGAFRFFRGGQCVAMDTGPSLRMESGRVAVTHLVSAEPAEISDDRIVICGTMGWAKTKAMTPLRLVALRLLMLGGGRLFPDLVRRVLQRLLITGKSAAPFQYRREVVWEAGGALRVRDEVRGPDWSRVAEAAIGCAQTSIYVVMSRTYQASQLLPWARLDAELAAARESGVLEAERRL